MKLTSQQPNKWSDFLWETGLSLSILLSATWNPSAVRPAHADAPFTVLNAPQMPPRDSEDFNPSFSSRAHSSWLSSYIVIKIRCEICAKNNHITS